MTELDEEVITEFRNKEGAVKNAYSGHFKDIHLLLLHHVGRRSGRPYVTPLLYVQHDEFLLLAGSNGGAESEPKWVANVEAMERVELEFGDRIVVARPTVLREGAERESLYAEMVAYWADFLKYEERTDRMFPVIRLDPIEANAVA
jgi:deazaflavin-dependent oxidoreductase (nitroreductase family)